MGWPFGKASGLPRRAVAHEVAGGVSSGAALGVFLRGISVLMGGCRYCGFVCEFSGLDCLCEGVGKGVRSV